MSPLSTDVQTTEKAYVEIVELFARGSGPAEILRFHPSRAAQQRALYLLSFCESAMLILRPPCQGD
jgi:hypothetical protein